jgi:hypothetical protein
LAKNSVTTKNETRYTLSLPENIYDSLKNYAEKNEVSIKQVVTKCLRLSLYAIDIENKGGSVIIREPDTKDKEIFKETTLKIF